MTFDSAKFYDASDPELLTHETPEDAIIAAWEERDAEDGPIVITAFRPIQVSEREYQAASEEAVEAALTYFSEYASPWADKDGLSAELQKELAEIVKIFLKRHYEAWACEPCGTREYSVEEVLEIVGEE